ncbi:MAG: alanine racemase [Melioribacteraceae bacterium]|nr:alanine racemase [Melioribacteraceae bacterium]
MLILLEKRSTASKISAVVKANAYGQLDSQIVPMLEKCGVNHFSVASASEVEIVLNSKSNDSKVMIMGILYGKKMFSGQLKWN